MNNDSFEKYISEQYISKYISNESFSNLVKEHLAFVNKYLAIIGSNSYSFDEKQILYKSLAVIAFSCVEGILNLVLFEIDRRCENKKCVNAECPYRKFIIENKSDPKSALQVLNYLNAVRLLGYIPEMIDKFDSVKEHRNFIHISKEYGDGHFNFDEQVVKEIISIYDNINDQLDLDSLYFNSSSSCLRESDDNGFETTLSMNRANMRVMYSYKLMMLFDKLFDNEKMNVDDIRIVKKLKFPFLYDSREVSDYYAKRLIRKGASKEDFEKISDKFFASLIAIVGECKFIVETRSLFKSKL